ncbi:hypothetical protein [Chitinophaga defluvii]|uniref:Uncharacterized protein n=1 Tax=Chitinophaga defluvii TaxID=3163343 RepID=A0ABV2TAZ6_9BACT
MHTDSDLLLLQHLILVDLVPHTQPNPPDYISFSRTTQVVTLKTANIKDKLALLINTQPDKQLLRSDLYHYQRCLVALAGELQAYIAISKNMPLPEIFQEFTWANLYLLIYKLLTELLAHINEHFMPYVDDTAPGN